MTYCIVAISTIKLWSDVWMSQSLIKLFIGYKYFSEYFFSHSTSILYHWFTHTHHNLIFTAVTQQYCSENVLNFNKSDFIGTIWTRLACFYQIKFPGINMKLLVIFKSRLSWSDIYEYSKMKSYTKSSPYHDDVIRSLQPTPLYSWTKFINNTEIHELMYFKSEVKEPILIKLLSNFTSHVTRTMSRYCPLTYHVGTYILFKCIVFMYNTRCIIYYWLLWFPELITQKMIFFFALTSVVY